MISLHKISSHSFLTSLLKMFNSYFVCILICSIHIKFRFLQIKSMKLDYIRCISIKFPGCSSAITLLSNAIILLNMFLYRRLKCSIWVMMTKILDLCSQIHINHCRISSIIQYYISSNNYILKCFCYTHQEFLIDN